MNYKYAAALFVLVLFVTSSIGAQSVEVSTNTTFPVCPGDEIILTATPTDTPDSVRWSPAGQVEIVDGSDDLMASFTGPRSVDVIVAAHYPDTVVFDTLEIDLHLAVVNINPGDTALNCIDEGETMLMAEIDAPIGTDIIWTPADGLSSTMAASITADPDSSTIYVATITTTDGCVVTDTVFLQVDSIFRDHDITAVPGPMDPCMKYCPGEEVALFSQMTEFDKYPRTMYDWTPKGSTSGGDTTQNISIETDVTKLYIRTAFHGACSEKDTILIEVVDPNIPTSVTDTSVCPGMPVNVSIDDTDLTEIEWTAMPEEGLQYLSCTDCPNPTIQIGSIGEVIGGTFTFEVMAEKEMCCPATGSVTIQVIVTQEPVVEVETCPDIPVQININPNLTDINWAENMGALSCDDCPNPTATVSNSQTFNYTALDGESCTVIGSANVIVLPPESLIDTVLNYCPGEPIIIDITEFNVNSIEWTGPPQTNLDCGDCEVQMATPTPAGTYQVIFNGRDVDGCIVSGFYSLQPFMNDQLSISLDSGSTYSVGSLAPVNLNIDPVPDDLMVTWCFEGIELPGIEGTNVELEVLREGENLFSAKLVDSFGCSQEIEIVISGVLPMIQIPKAFTPNNDDENDFFIPVITNADGSPANLITDFKVFSRWGELVYENDDNTVGWDGDQDGERAPSDVYVYLITVTYPDQTSELFKGDVTLLR